MEIRKPELSDHFKSRKPSAIRTAQIDFAANKNNRREVNVAIGNVSLPMHKDMIYRMCSLGGPDSPFRGGVVKYSATVGRDETRDAVKNIISSSGFDAKDLYVQVTAGGSQGMILVPLGTCGKVGSEEKPLLLIDAAYTNYNAALQRLRIPGVSITRYLQENGKYGMPETSEIEKKIEETNPGAMVVIPYDNPTGHFYDKKTMVDLGKICVKHNMWMISDEAYRELYYVDHPISSIWGLTEEDVPGITGRRISIETASKVWNGCGLRIGALVTDNKEFHEKAVNENTLELCPGVIDQYIFGAIAHKSHEELQDWYKQQRNYYKELMFELTAGLREALPGVIVSSPDASIYSVADVRKIAKPGFDAKKFVEYCAKEGKVNINGEDLTLLVAPMPGFYNGVVPEKNPGNTQMRIAYVAEKEDMKLVPTLFTELFKQYEAKRD